MKFKKQIFALGAVAIIAAPIVGVVSCGNNTTTNPKPIDRVTYSASNPDTTNGQTITISAGLVTYSSKAIVKNDTYTFVDPATKVKTVYTAISTPVSGAAAVTLSVMVGNTKGNDVTANLARPLATGIVLSDTSGVYYITEALAISASTPIIGWVNYNTGILAGTTNKATALKNITKALAGTGLNATVITFTNKMVATLKITKFIPEAKKVTSGQSFALPSTEQHGAVIYSEGALAVDNVFVFNDLSSGVLEETTYKVTTIANDSTTLTLSKSVNKGAFTGLGSTIPITAVTTGVELRDYTNHKIYVADATATPGPVLTWLNDNNIVNKTNDATVGAKMVTKALTPAGYTCSSLTFESNGTIKSITLVKITT